jgi:hypothetical protein
MTNEIMQEPETPRRSWKGALAENAGQIVLFAVLAASLALNVTLGWKVKAANAREARLRNPGIQAGARLPESIPVVDLAGNATALTLRDSRRTVLYVLSPSCGWCERNNANIRALAAARSSELRFVGLSLQKEKLREYVDAAGLGFPVFALGSGEERLIGTLGLGSTPQTAVVSPAGVVEKVWGGALTAASQKEAEGFFRVTLPGLTEPKNPVHARAEP